MATLVVRRPANRPDRSLIYARPGGGPPKTVCKYWLQGRCTKAFCRFLHQDASLPQNHISKLKKGLVWTKDGKGNASNDSAQKRNAASPTPLNHISKQKKGLVWTKDGKGTASNDTQKSNAAQKSNVTRNSNATLKGNVSNDAQKNNTTGKGNAINDTEKSNEASQNCQERVCKMWVDGNCLKVGACNYLHKWFCGEGFSMLANLQGHTKAVTGIALPERTNKLYSVGKDEAARIWDCHTGQCLSVIDLGGEAGCLICEGSWVFVGVPNLVKAWNTESKAEFNLDGPIGQVHSMVVGNEMLFAGTQDGVIFVWKGCSETKSFIPAATLKCHTGAVVCLTAAGKRLYSGSVDHTIGVWDLDTLQCLMILNGHSGAVTSLICWHQFLLSGSLDDTINVWAVTEGGRVEVTYTHHVEHGVLDLARMDTDTDTEAKPILLCSCNDNSVCLYELPSFAERGRLFAKEEVQRVEVGPGGLFFGGDASGLLSVWKWMEPGFKAESP